MSRNSLSPQRWRLASRGDSGFVEARASSSEGAQPPARIPDPAHEPPREPPHGLRGVPHALPLSPRLDRPATSRPALQDESERNQDYVAEDQQDRCGGDRSLRKEEVAQGERDQPRAAEHQVHPGEAERCPFWRRTRRGRLLAAGHSGSYGPGPTLSTQPAALAAITRPGRDGARALTASALQRPPWGSRREVPAEGPSRAATPLTTPTRPRPRGSCDKLRVAARKPGRRLAGQIRGRARRPHTAAKRLRPPPVI